MPHLLPHLPRVEPEPPTGYVAFVAEHLDRLRAQARAELGDAREGDDLYPEVLTDVALSWPRLELARTRLHRPRPAERYLRLTLARRLARVAAPDGEAPAIQFEVWSEQPGPPRPADVVRFGAGTRGAGPTGTPAPANGGRPDPVPARVPVPARGNAAVRLAPLLLPPDAPAAPVAEAAIAWWHAYRRRHQRRAVAAAVAGAALLVVAFGYLQSDPTVQAAPAAPAAVTRLR